MKTAAFITIHVGFNFGSVLQTIATSHLLQEHGYSPVCINYIPPRVTYKRYWQEANNGIVKMFRRVMFFPFFHKATKNFSKYLAKYCPLTSPIYAEDDYSVKCPKADLYVTGSDQVWNYCHNEGLDVHYFFDGITGKKIAFSSSIGMKELPPDYEAYMKGALKSYEHISVREDSAVDVLAGMGIEAIQLLDPTLLINKDAWKTYASPRLVKEHYLFVYLPYNTVDIELVYRTVRRISRSRNLLVVTYSRDFFKVKLADKTVTFANPGDILSLIYHADYVITNSFHGTAFSINLNKQFWVYMPSKYSTRIGSLLRLCNLEGRNLADEITESQVDEQIDYQDVNAVLDSERARAHAFLAGI